MENSITHREARTQSLELLTEEIKQFEAHLKSVESHLQMKEQQLLEYGHKIDQYGKEIQSNQERYKKQLEKISHCSAHVLTQQLQETHTHQAKLNLKKWSLDNEQRMVSQSKIDAKNILETILNRYSPTFIWPKSSYLIPLPENGQTWSFFFQDTEERRALLENTECEIEYQENAADGPQLKVVGGLGTDKEVLRLTLEQTFKKQIKNVQKILNIKSKNTQEIEQFVMNLGHQAVDILELNKAIHPEILKLIGSLYFRTSHRQNQYYHSLEVATLAGMLAQELGVDTQLAKRSGLLHDIGKVLDYKIEGGHAVISGEYATRYEETEDVVDTILAHHDDKQVDTAHAYILKAADAMSGARPGARVDTEEGYQKRLEDIQGVMDTFKRQGMMEYNIMGAGREVRVIVDPSKIRETDIMPFAQSITTALKEDIFYQGQIKVTVIRRLEVWAVA